MQPPRRTARLAVHRRTTVPGAVHSPRRTDVPRPSAAGSGRASDRKSDLSPVAARLFLAVDSGLPAPLRLGRETLKVPVIDHGSQTETWLGPIFRANCLVIEQLPSKQAPHARVAGLGLRWLFESETVGQPRE